MSDNEQFEAGLHGRPGDVTHNDYRDGKNIRDWNDARRRPSSNEGGGGGGGSAIGGAASGAGVFLIYLIVPAAVIALSVVSAVVVAALALMILSYVWPRAERVSFLEALPAAIWGMLAIMVGGLAIGLAITFLSTNVLAGQYWLTMPVVSEVAGFARSMPLLWAAGSGWFGGTAVLAFEQSDIYSIVVGKTVLYGPGLLIFAGLVRDSGAFSRLPKAMDLLIRLLVCAGIATAAVMVGNVMTGIASASFTFFPYRLGGFPWGSVFSPALLALLVFLVCGVVAGPLQLALGRLYNPQKWRASYVRAGWRMGFFYALAGLVTMIVMTGWPVADGLLWWASLNSHLNPFVPTYLLDPYLWSVMSGYLIAALPAVLGLTWLIHDDSLVRKDRPYDLVLAFLMAAWPMVVIGPAAALVAMQHPEVLMPRPGELLYGY